MGYFSNGTEGRMFEDAWCSRCVHSDVKPGAEIGVTPPCPVWFAHELYAYELCNKEEHPGKVILEILMPHDVKPAGDGYGIGVNECKMFHPVDAGAAVPGQTSLEVEVGRRLAARAVPPEDE